MSLRKSTRILIDPGHGGADPGAVGGGLKESEVNLRVAQALASMLRDKGFVVVMTRHIDRTVALAQRVRLAGLFAPDLFLSLHCNAATNEQASGIEVWTSPGDTAADPIATQIFLAMSRAFPDRKLRTDYADNDPDKEARFYVLVHTTCPAVLVEMGFLSNPEERRWLDWLENPLTAGELAAAICDGVMEHFSEPQNLGPFGMSMNESVGGRDGLD